KSKASTTFSDQMRAVVETEWRELVHKPPPKSPQRYETIRAARRNEISRSLQGFTTRSPPSQSYLTEHRLRSDRRATVHSSSTDLIPGAIFGAGARDRQFAYGVASLAPSGDGIKDDFYGGRSHLSELQIASRLSFNSIRLGLQEIFCFLQL